MSKNDEKILKNGENIKNNSDFTDIFGILPHDELKYYIKTYLLNDNEFIQEVDDCMADGRLISMNLDERIEYFNCHIGNESRTYILKILTLKHLSKILEKNMDKCLDEYWKNKYQSATQKQSERVEYSSLVAELLKDKFPGKTESEIAELSVEDILNNPNIEIDRNSEIEVVVKSVKKEHPVEFKKPEYDDILQIINEVALCDKISISMLQRKFYISYPKGAKIVDMLIEEGAVERVQSGYKVLDKQKLEDILKKNLV